MDKWLARTAALLLATALVACSPTGERGSAAPVRPAPFYPA